MGLNLNNAFSVYVETKEELVDVISERINNCKEGDKTINLTDIDVSNIEDFSYLFPMTYTEQPDYIKLNFLVNNWDMSNAKLTNSMFYKCKNFNDDLSSWDVSNVEDMSGMFFRCEKLDCDLSNWNVSKCKMFNFMFNNCKQLSTDLSEWDINTSHSNTLGMLDNCDHMPKKFYPKRKN